MELLLVNSANLTSVAFDGTEVEGGGKVRIHGWRLVFDAKTGTPQGKYMSKTKPIWTNCKPRVQSIGLNSSARAK